MKLAKLFEAAAVLVAGIALGSGDNGLVYAADRSTPDARKQIRPRAHHPYNEG